MAAAPIAGTRVRLAGLVSRPDLNGRLGVVVDSEEATAQGRVAVELYARDPAAAAAPESVCAKAANLEPLPPQPAVEIRGSQVTAAQLSGERSQALARGRGRGWMDCPVPELLGLPIKMLRLGTPRLQNESLATYLLVSPSHGFAPNDVQANGLGAVVVARSDGEAITPDEVWSLHNYMCNLMDEWPKWLDDPEGTREEKRRALTPAAFRAFTENNANMEGGEEEDEEEEED
ncbi:hypothetical protein Rsub_11302 [Raphidocelis subcapitata]|uniref:Uncharacterized protein n=1 Tax=Raphidocelis subcapitata TaxID=307507 RepID=A0A2V0PMI6_9CHLO|nr:hypothetical protein Rsub_11302 [Raphidocelis subcapitata]|eukprot:GBF98577.1 hypothetical protein Rsub_11302 [Raphidocelis subcapitata]